MAVRVEATGGVNVRVGDWVEKGQVLGLAPDLGGPVGSPVSGTVEAVYFVAGGHQFEVVLRPGRGQGTKAEAEVEGE